MCNNGLIKSTEAVGSVYRYVLELYERKTIDARKNWVSYGEKYPKSCIKYHINPMLTVIIKLH